MAQTLEAIEIGDNQELLRLVEAVNEQGAPVVLRRGGADVAVLTRIPPASQRKSRPQLSEEDLAAFRSAAGSWHDVDTDKLIEDIYENRRRSVSPPVDL